jgi:hypothetical protein
MGTKLQKEGIYKYLKNKEKHNFLDDTRPERAIHLSPMATPWVQKSFFLICALKGQLIW